MITAQQLKEIKNQLNTEISRRNNSKSQGPVTTNAAFSKDATAGEGITTEYGNKTLGVMTKVSAVGSLPLNSPDFKKGDIIPDEFDYTIMKNFVSQLAAKAATATAGQANTGCAGSCTGLCAGTCYSECTGNFSGSFFSSFSGKFSGDFSNSFSGSHSNSFSANGPSFSGNFSNFGGTGGFPFSVNFSSSFSGDSSFKNNFTSFGNDSHFSTSFYNNGNTW